MNSVIRPLLLLVIAALLAGCGKTVTLQAALQDTDANEIVMALTTAGIVVAKHQDKTGVSLQVAEADIPRATAVMQAAGLPRRNRSNLGEVFKKQGMISSPMEERIRYLHGLSEELEATLQQFDNVVSARVHVVLPERIAPGEPIQPSSAAVFIKYRMPLDEDAITPRIRRLVASSIPGLVGEDGRSKVTVVMTLAEAPPPPVEWTMVGPFKIEAESAAGVRSTLYGMAALLVLALGYVGFNVAKRHPAVARMLARRAAKRGADAAAGAAG
jgi:type III secretion protein J